MKNNKTRPKYLPKKIIRDDGAEFLLNEATQQYHIWLPGLKEDLGVHGFSYERLIEDSRNEGIFKVADGTEDILAMKRAWWEKMDRITQITES